MPPRLFHGILTLPLVNSARQSHQYVNLLRSVYKAANSLNAPFLLVSLLSTLFSSLGLDALAFLAGIWSEPENNENEGNIHVVALHHGIAFLKAHSSVEDGTDFQTILPSLFIPLQRASADQRLAAMGCIQQLHQQLQGKLKTVYRFDTIYGKATGK
jgi:U3 small nucleolar RNA-associated protein 10